MTCQAVPLKSQSISATSRTTIHHLDQNATPVLSHRPLPPTTSRRRGPGLMPVPDANATQGPPPPRSAHTTQNPPHWVHHHDPRCAINNRNPWCGHRGPGSAGDKAKGFRGRGKEMEKSKEKLEKEAPCVMCHKIEQ
ncbi:unnamed protein product, partial [Pleuronectes platessa]